MSLFLRLLITTKIAAEIDDKVSKIGFTNDATPVPIQISPLDDSLYYEYYDISREIFASKTILSFAWK